MKVIDKKGTVAILLTLLVLTGIFMINNTSYALLENTPEIVSFEPSTAEDNALKVEVKSNNTGSDFSLEILNITKGTRVNVAGSTTSYTFQNLINGKEYEVMVRACSLSNNKYKCTDYSPSKKQETKVLDSEKTNTGPTIEGKNAMSEGVSTQLKATFPNSCLGREKTGTSCAQGIVDVTSKVNWTSSDTSVATISDTGFLTSIKEGEVLVTAIYTHDDGVKVSSSYKITILPKKADLDTNEDNTNTNTNTNNNNNNNSNNTATLDDANNTQSSQNSAYVVTFDIYNGKQIKTVNVNSNSKVSKPEDPEREGYTFAGWYTTREYKNLYDFEKPVTENMTLYAKWNINTYKVTFNSNGGSPVDVQAVNYKNLATKPKDPTKNGYYFSGWYKDAYYEKKFSFLTEIKNDTTLYAYWTLEPLNNYDVTFVPGHDIDPFIMEIEPGNYAEPPSLEVETSNNELLKEATVSWYTDEAKTTQYDFDAAINSDLVLYGKWINKEGTEILETPDTAVSKNIIYVVVGLVLTLGGGFVIFKYVLRKPSRIS